MIQTVLFEWLQSFGVFLLFVLAGCVAGWLTPSLTWLMSLAAYAAGGILFLGIASLLSVITVFFRDTGYLMPVVMQTLFFLSPVAYSIDKAPESIRWLLQLSPISLLIESIRQPLLTHTLPWNHFAGLVGWAAGLYLLSQWVFKAFDRTIVLRV